jgi:hypothetical protein
MAEKIPTLPADSPVPTEVYRPLSRLALAALIVAALYAVVIGVLAVVAFVTGKPLFLGIETLAIPAVAAALAYVGRQQIRGSEGVLSGTALTTWALWLSGLSGLGFAAYYFGTYLAVTWQAGTFTRTWLDKVRGDKFMEAFLDTQKPEKRKNDKPGDRLYMYQAYGAAAGPAGRKGPLPAFLESEAFKVLHDAATAGEIKSLGVKDWSFSKDAYNVAELYQAKTPEGVYELLIPVRGSQGPEFEGRQWQVVWEGVGYVGTPQLTETGKLLAQWRYHARQFGSAWLQRRSQGDLAAVYLDTLPPDRRRDAYRQMQNRLLLGELRPGPLVDLGGPLNRIVQAGLLANGEAAGLLFVPGFREFAQGKLVQADELVAPPAVREELVSAVRQNFLRPNVIRIQPQNTQARAYAVNRDLGQYRFLLDAEVTVEGQGEATPAASKYRCDAYLVVESDTGPMTPERQPVWRVAGLQLILGGVATPPPGPGPKPPMPSPRG